MSAGSCLIFAHFLHKNLSPYNRICLHKHRCDQYQVWAVVKSTSHHKKKRWSDPVTPFWHSRAENYELGRLWINQQMWPIWKSTKTSHQISVLMCGSPSSHCSSLSFSSPEIESINLLFYTVGSKGRNLWCFKWTMLVPPPINWFILYCFEICFWCNTSTQSKKHWSNTTWI